MLYASIIKEINANLAIAVGETAHLATKANTFDATTAHCDFQ
jgi:hypothetical protein